MKKIAYWSISCLTIVLLIVLSGTVIATESEDIILINTVADLRNISNNLSGNFILANDINLDGEEWIPIGTTGEPFTGTLDGNGYRIKNISISGNKSYIGLFGSVNGGEFNDLTFENAIISGDSYIGVLAGHIKGGYTINNCNLTGVITITGSNQYIGGLIGYCYDGTFNKISGQVSVSGSNNVGGLAGYIGMSNVDYSELTVTVRGTGESNGIGGLLGYVYNSQVNNSNVDGQISGQETIGGLIGLGNIVTINNCSSQASINGTNSLGGIIGVLDRGIIKRCYSIGEVTGVDYIGGLAGQLINKGKLENCYSEGIIIADQYVGGLIGYAESYSVVKCFTTTNISTYGSYIGGLIGFMEESWDKINITYCFALGEIEALDTCDYIGGLIGYCKGGQKIKQCYAGIAAEKGTLSNGLVGYGDAVLCENSYYDGTISNCNQENSYGKSQHTQEMRIEETFEDWDFSQVWSIDKENSYPYLKNMNIPKRAISNLPTIIMQGKGTEESPYEIFSTQQLDHIRYNLNAYYRLQDDFNLENTLWMPIGTSEQPFSGVFDGNGYSISNLRIIDNGDYSGFFGYVSSGQLFDLVIDNADVTGEQYVGTLVGYATKNYKIENITLIGANQVKGKNYVGGLIGRGFIGDVINVSVYANVDGTKSVGGLAGSIRSGMIENCNVDGYVKGIDSQIGGVVGFLSEATLINSYCTAFIDGNIKVGGIVGLLGYHGKATITNCYFSASVNGINEVGGVTGSNYEGANNSCYFDSINSNIIKPIDQARTTDELMNEQTYTNWDFESIWRIDEGANYPQFIKLDAPKSLETWMLTSTSISIKWDEVENATGYELEVDRNVVINLGNVTSYIHKNIIPGTQHRYRIRAINDNEASNWSSKIVETTLLDTPENIIGEFVAGTGINISWDSVEHANGYKIEINGEEIVIDDTSYFIQDYSDNNQYIYRVKAINDITDSTWTEKQSLITWDINKTGICLALESQKTHLGSDEIVSLILKGNNITDLYTIQLNLTYDPTKLVFTQDQIQDLLFLETEEPYYYIDFNGTEGKIRIMLSITGDNSGLNGNFDILRIEGDMIQDVLTQVDIHEIKLVDSDARYINITEPQYTNIWILSER